MVTALSIAVAALLLTVVFLAVWAIELRSRSHRQDAELRSLRAARVSRNAPKADGRSSPRAAPPADDDNLDIPAALVGTRWKAAIDRLAPVLGTTPVQLLRASISAGLTGGRPIATEMLGMLDKLVKEGDVAPPSKPGPSNSH